MDAVPSWSKYFMTIAEAVALRSKDSSTKVGAILVDENNHIISTGYNGMPLGFPDTVGLWEKPTKYTYVVHAEANCLLHALKDTKGCTLYSTMYPCGECAKLIAAAGVKKVVYSSDKYLNEVSRLIFSQCSIAEMKLK